MYKITEEQILEVAPLIAADLRPSGVEDVEETESYAISVAVAIFNELNSRKMSKEEILKTYLPLAWLRSDLTWFYPSKKEFPFYLNMEIESYGYEGDITLLYCWDSERTQGRIYQAKRK